MPDIALLWERLRSSPTQSRLWLELATGYARCDLQADTGAVTLIQRFGSAANLNIHLHCLVLDGVYRRTGGEPVFQEARAPTPPCVRIVVASIDSMKWGAMMRGRNGSIRTGI